MGENITITGHDLASPDGNGTGSGHGLKGLARALESTSWNGRRRSNPEASRSITAPRDNCSGAPDDATGCRRIWKGTAGDADPHGMAATPTEFSLSVSQ